MRNIVQAESPAEHDEEMDPSCLPFKDDPSLDEDLNRFRSVILSIGRRQSLRDPISTICEDFGLSPAQLHCLLWLGFDTVLTMGELARRVGITEKTMTGIVDRMEAAGHIQRERDTADRRVVRVRLTPGGSALFEQMESAVRRRMRHIFSSLDRTDRQSLINIFQKLNDRLDPNNRVAGEETK